MPPKNPGDNDDKPMSALERYLAKQKAEKARATPAATPAKDKSRLFARAEAQAQAYADSKTKPSQKEPPVDPRAKPKFAAGERPSLAGIERPEPLQPPSLSRWESVAESRLSETEKRAREAGAPAAPPPRLDDPSPTIEYRPISHEVPPVDEWRPITDTAPVSDGIPNADFGTRAIATVIDWTIIAVLDVVAQKVLFALLGVSIPRRSLDGFEWVLYFGVLYAYYGYFYSVKGASPGKLLLGLEVTGEDGRTYLTPWRAFFREAIGKFISAVPFFMGYVIVMIRLDHRALHDLLFDTRVIRKKGGV